MCIGNPMRVICMLGVYALCKGDGERKMVDMTFVGEQPPGTWVLEFLGCAREVITEENAILIGNVSRALERILKSGEGANDQFTDFCNREPELSHYLQTGICKKKEAFIKPPSSFRHNGG